MKSIHRVHFKTNRSPVGLAYCGRDYPTRYTYEIAEVTCRRCIVKLWKEIALVHYRAFPEYRGPRMRKITRALKSMELETRRPVVDGVVDPVAMP